MSELTKAYISASMCFNASLFPEQNQNYHFFYDFMVGSAVLQKRWIHL
jgi:hypothetical protein